MGWARLLLPFLSLHPRPSSTYPLGSKAGSLSRPYAQTSCPAQPEMVQSHHHTPCGSAPRNWYCLGLCLQCKLEANLEVWHFAVWWFISLLCNSGKSWPRNSLLSVWLGFLFVCLFCFFLNEEGFFLSFFIRVLDNWFCASGLCPWCMKLSWRGSYSSSQTMFSIRQLAAVFTNELILYYGQALKHAVPNSFS